MAYSTEEVSKMLAVAHDDERLFLQILKDGRLSQVTPDLLVDLS